MARRPIVGITSYAQPAKWGAWELPAALVPWKYVESVERAGGRPLLVPPSADGVEETLDALDGLIFSGGIDIDPAAYGADRHPSTDPAQAHRDAGELALLEAALARDLPTLAICRGFQLLNILRGGDLVQHLPETVGHSGHREVLGAFSEHAVDVKDGHAPRVDPRPAPPRREVEPPPGHRPGRRRPRRDCLGRGRIARRARGSRRSSSRSRCSGTRRWRTTTSGCSRSSSAEAARYRASR